jgi:ATP-dependent Clp protease ATP-binding subunit ClpX
MIAFGMIPELIGRLPVVTTMKYLSKNEMLQILIKPKNALIKQYKKLFEIEGIELVFDEDAMHQIVEIAQKRNSGARALRAVMEECLMDLMYKVPEMSSIEKLTISKDFILGNAEPKYDHATKKRSA